MSDTPELLPCPFCNVCMINLPHHDFKHPVDLTSEDEKACPLNARKFHHSERAAWNTRAPVALMVKPLEWRDSYGVERADVMGGTWFIKGKIAEFRATDFSMCPGGDLKAAVEARHEAFLRSQVEAVPAQGSVSVKEAQSLVERIERYGVEHDRMWGVPENSLVVFREGNITCYLPTPSKEGQAND